MDKVYFISGLGADKRVFAYLDLSFCEPVHIDWIDAEQDESLAHYAMRLRELIPEKNPVIVGLSFGGMLATEMAKKDPGVKSIIISSNKLASEFPRHLKVFRHFPFHKVIPGSALKRYQKAYTSIFGVKNPEQRKLIYQIVADSDMKFVKWAVTAILKWDNAIVPENIVHIHGTGDRLLPYKRTKAQYIIQGGSHVMTLDKADEISVILRQLIESK
ncbi:MAG: alpha/beta hydrolase [Chitinophagaceae bacterium]|nr:MAG: alpha/beta hydrolase [Chitinophagaceae bacterium]